MTPSPAQITELLKQAADTVREAGLPENLEPLAFERALDALGVSDAPAGRPAAGGEQAGAGIGLDPAPVGSGLLSRIAARLDVDPSLIARVYDEEDGQVRLIVKRTMLPEVSKKAASMRHVALLVVVGRQAAGLDEYTPYDAIREECRELKVYDGPNFAAEVGKLEFRTKGGRNTKEARANRHHYDEAGDLIRRMTGEGES